MPTTYEDGVLSWTHTPTHGSIYYAYFAPYRCAARSRASPCKQLARGGSSGGGAHTSPGARPLSPPTGLPSHRPLRSYERHQELVAEMQCQEGVTLEMLVGAAGRSWAGRLRGEGFEWQTWRCKVVTLERST